MSARIEISLFGTCTVRIISNKICEVHGAKHRAIFAMLATAPLGVLTRKYLQNTLWGYAGYDNGNQNLNRALSNLRKEVGTAFDQLFHTTISDVELNMDCVDFVGDMPDCTSAATHFLEDINVTYSPFVEWVEAVRRNPDHVIALYQVKLPTPRLRPKLRVAALPLSGIGGSAELPTIGDWIAEEICRSLSRSYFLNVISHLSSRAIMKRSIDLIDIRKALDVDYVVTGTLRSDKKLLVANIDLVCASSGATQWLGEVRCAHINFAENLSEKLETIMRSIGNAIMNDTINYVRDRSLPMVEDHKLIIIGVSMMHRLRMRDFLKSRKYLEEAVKRMPKVADTHAWLSNWYILSVFNGLAINNKKETRKALDEIAKALDLDPTSSFSLTIAGFAYNNLLKDMPAAEKYYRKALNVNPNESLAWLLRGALMAFQDEGNAAIRATSKARHLSPIDPFGYFYDSLSSTAHLAAENYSQALFYADRSIDLNHRHISTLRAKITALHFLDRGPEARDTAKQLLLQQPNFKLEEYRQNHPSANNKLGLSVIEAMAAAGIA